jgi:outer membrane receptor protein involved in Fe transport
VSTGLNGATNPYASSTANFPTAEVRVWEFAGEAEVPLLKDMFLARSLGANLAARYTDYSTSGGVWSWKIGLTWKPIDDLTVRVTRSRDIRAPTLANLFQPLTIGTSVPLADVHVYGTDPATGQPYNNNATPITVNQGNPKLLPELGDTTTAGYVWQPHFLPGFSVSMDAYFIKITQGIFSPSAFQPATQRACEDSGGTSPVCALYVRPLPFSNHTSANLVTQTNNILVNTGGVRTYGLDTEVDYAHPINGHRFSTRLLMNYQPHLVYDLSPAPIVDVGGAADGVNVLPATPSFKALMQVNYEVIENLTLTVQERYRDRMKQNGNTGLIFVNNWVPSAYWTDLNFAYRFKKFDGDMELYLNIRNVFNKQPTLWASTGGTGQIGTFGGWLQGDDPVGRYYKLGLSYKF